ncbi:MAG: YciI family protein [Paracoccaceae bacterium]
MLVALIAHDKANHLDVRTQNRAAHLEYIKGSGKVAQAGPFLDEDGEMIGSLIVLEVDSFPDAQNWAQNDPYAKAGLFESVRLIRWNKVI